MATTRKRKATQKDKDETPVKRAKTEDQTPTESANSEDETPTKHVKNENDTPAKRAPAPRSAKAKRNDPEWLVTNEKSPLAIEDLHAELCNPKTYEGFTKEDWEDLRSTLPDNVPLNPDGYSISTHFLKYDPDFRRGIREFQEDLASGRLEPAWLEAAAEAMEERANGEFDDFKEKNYEEFWGQKQKLAWGTLAGESTTLKLEVMIEHDVFRVGDEIVFVRAIGRGEKRVLLEKECKIASIAKKKMTLAIPPGKLRFARQSMKEETSPQANAEAKGRNKQELDAVVASLDASGGQEELLVQNGLNGHQLNTDSKGAATVLENFESGWDLTSTEMKSNHETPVIGSNGVNNNSTNPSPDPPSDAVILFEINSLKQLNDKIIDIDGRLNPKDPKEVPAVSPWKIMRAKRNNQDLGTLFEMRDDFYTYKLPYIGKTKRGKK